MPFFETYSHRKRMATRSGEPEIYTYDKAPDHMRHQICLALSEGIGNYYAFSGNEFDDPPNANSCWKKIDRICRRELQSYLVYTDEQDLKVRFLKYVAKVKDIDDFLSAVELGCIVLSAVNDQYDQQTIDRGAEQRGLTSVKEINGRFEQHAVGYQFENGQIIRVDSKLMHAEVIIPALRLLAAPMFAKAEAEFMTAHRHYRVGEYKDCVTAANRAYESTLKAICDTEGWEYGKGDRASDLVTRVTNKGLFTHDFDQSLISYVAMLKTGLPSVRNNAGGHGEGLAAAAVTAPIARFALNMTASNILFLNESYAALKKQ